MGGTSIAATTITAPSTPQNDPPHTPPSNPFVSPPLSTHSLKSHLDLPQRPEPCAKCRPWMDLPSTHHRQRPEHRPYAAGHERTDSACCEKMGSWSSGGTMDTLAAADPEKGLAVDDHERRHAGRSCRISKHTKRGLRSSRQSVRDPEKAAAVDSRRHSAVGSNLSENNNMTNHDDDVVDDDDDDQEDDHTLADKTQRQHAVGILLFLAGPVVGLSFVNLFWTIVSVFITALAQPVRLCARRPTFGQQLAGLLGPALNLQLRCIYTPLPPYANEDGSYHTPMLIAVQLLSPFVGLGVAIASWVVAVYWVLAVIIGEPDPAVTEKRDDGRDTCLALRRWWELWLSRSLKQ